MRKLIIVCEEKYRKFGDYLSQLISLADDTEDKITGIKDGSVVAVVWVEKDYDDNAAHISSDQYYLFIGHSKRIEEISTFMQIKFYKYGMAYGWLGKQAVLTVDASLKKAEYNNFLLFAEKYSKNIKSLVTEKQISEKNSNSEKTNGLTVLTAKLDMITDAAKNTAKAGIDAIKFASQGKKVEEQQYACAVSKFYLDSLSEFLNLNHREI